MFLKNTINFILACLVILTSITLTSCSQLEKEDSTLNNLTGDYHFLSDKGVKIFLPTDFKKHTLVEYQNLLKEEKNKKSSAFKIERLNMLRKMEGNFYIFFNKTSQSTFTANTIPYFEFNKNDANQLLSYIKLTNENKTSKKEVKLSKITAKYTGNKKQQIFKSIHKIENLKSKTESYNTAYIISSNDKTVILQLLSPEEVDFDSYIQKIKM